MDKSGLSAGRERVKFHLFTDLLGILLAPLPSAVFIKGGSKPGDNYLIFCSFCQIAQIFLSHNFRIFYSCRQYEKVPNYHSSFDTSCNLQDNYGDYSNR